MRFWTDDRLEGFGTRVIFAEDFRKPAYCNVSNKNKITTDTCMSSQAYIEFIAVNVFQIDYSGVLAWVVMVDIAYTMRCQVH